MNRFRPIAGARYLSLAGLTLMAAAWVLGYHFAVGGYVGVWVWSIAGFVGGACALLGLVLEQ